jgi:hypothetical protein
MKAIFTRFGIRTFRPTLRKAEDKIKGLAIFVLDTDAADSRAPWRS